MLDCDNVPLFPLQTVLFPGMTIPLHIFEERYRLMIARCLEQNSPFGVVLIREGSEVDDGSGPPLISRVGCFARIVRNELLPDGRYFIEVTGDTRFAVDEVRHSEPYLTGRVTPLEDILTDSGTVDTLHDRVSRQFRQYIAGLLARMNRTVSAIQLPGDPSVLSFAVAGALDIPPAEKQKLLETPTTDERLQLEFEYLRSPQSLPTEPPGAPEELDGSGDADLIGEDSTIKPLRASAVRSLISRN